MSGHWTVERAAGGPRQPLCPVQSRLVDVKVITGGREASEVVRRSSAGPPTRIGTLLERRLRTEQLCFLCASY